MSVRLRQDFGAVFPKLSDLAGEDLIRAWLMAFTDAFPERDWESFERLRSFPLFLRNEARLRRLREPAWVDLALWEWAEFASLFSPADEGRTREALRPSERVLNPTAHILRLEFDLPLWLRANLEGEAPPAKKMIFTYRTSAGKSFTLRHLEVDWSMAAILDVFLENGRLGDDVLRKEIQAHQGTGFEAEWLQKVRALVAEGLILEGA